MNSKALKNQAIEVIKKASTEFGILATAEQQDNYSRVWARDSVVSGLAILSQNLDDLYPAFKQSLLSLVQSAGPNGQIPSNVSVDKNGQTTAFSFGGPVGRTDASFWWIVGSIALLKKLPDEALMKQVKTQCQLIFSLAESWEFNGKHLMYVPMSSNWADEYITHGYVLYDQLLRYWALCLSGDFFNQPAWQTKANQVKKAIVAHYFFTTDLALSLYTQAQQAQLKTFNLSKNFVASFSPGDRVERFDAWSIGLILMLDIAPDAVKNQLKAALQNIFLTGKQKGIPAFWPLIESGDEAFGILQNNHSYKFKNYAGHFHNGGIWPVVNGFVISGLKHTGMDDLAKQLHQSLTQQLLTIAQSHPFAEYFDWAAGEAHGVKNLCFSASGYLLADAALTHDDDWIKSTGLMVSQSLAQKYQQLAGQILQRVNLSAKNTIAIAISGESGSGKTTLALALQEMLTDNGLPAIILHQDEYFRLPPRQNHQKRIEDFNWIGKQEVRLDLIDHHLKLIKSQQQKQLKIPKMNWEKDIEEQVTIAIETVKVVIVEGTYTAFLNEIDYRIFINSTYKQTHQNRVGRGREEVTDFIERVLAKESKIIQSAIKKADLVVNANAEIVN